MKNKLGKKIVIGIVALFILILICSLFIGDIGNSEAKEHINLGNKYMEDLDYEQALAEYMTALEIDADNKKASAGVETASVEYAGKVLEGELTIEECSDLLNVLEKSYTLVPRESIDNKVMEIKQIISDKEKLKKEAKDQEEKEEKLIKWREDMEEEKNRERKLKKETEYYRWILLQIYGNSFYTKVSIEGETDDSYIFIVERRMSGYNVHKIVMDKATEIGVVTEDKLDNWDELEDVSPEFSAVGKEYDMHVTDEIRTRCEEDEEWKKEWRKEVHM